MHNSMNESVKGIGNLSNGLGCVRVFATFILNNSGSLRRLSILELGLGPCFGLIHGRGLVNAIAATSALTGVGSGCGSWTALRFRNFLIPRNPQILTLHTQPELAQYARSAARPHTISATRGNAAPFRTPLRFRAFLPSVDRIDRGLKVEQPCRSN